MLSPVELEKAAWGREFKRQVKTAAASVELYEDAQLAARVGVSRNAVQGWWRGAKPSAETLVKIARAIGLSADELLRYVYNDGPPPITQQPPDPATVADAQEWARSVDVPSPLRPQAPRGGTGRS